MTDRLQFKFLIQHLSLNKYKSLIIAEIKNIKVLKNKIVKKIYGEIIEGYDLGRILNDISQIDEDRSEME